MTAAPLTSSESTASFATVFGAGRGRPFAADRDGTASPACPQTGRTQLRVRQGPVAEDGDWSDWWVVGWVGSDWTARFCTGLTTLPLWQQHLVEDRADDSPRMLHDGDFPDALIWDQVPEAVRQRIAVEAALGIRRQPMRSRRGPLDLDWRRLRPIERRTPARN